MRKAFVTVLFSAAALVAGSIAGAAPAAAGLAPPASLDPPVSVVATPDVPEDLTESAAAEVTDVTVECIAAEDARFLGRISIATGVVSATLLGADGAELCDPVTLNVTWFALPPTWDGNGFNSTSLPQTLIDHVDLTVPAGTATGESVATDALPLPDCQDYQLDLYYGDKRTEITKDVRIGTDLIRAAFVNVDENDEKCQEPTPTTTTTAPVETTTPPVETTTPPVETTTPPAETTTVPTTAPVGGTTTPSTTTPPALAFTGVGGTGALVSLAAALVLGGVALVFVTASTRGTRGTRRG